MQCRLSKTAMESFCGDVLPLYLISDADLSHRDIRWSVDRDCVGVRSFAGDESTAVAHCALLTFRKPGSAVVTAELDGKQYHCRVSVGERKSAGSDDELQYFVGDMHDHTTMTHDPAAFAEKNCEFPIDMIEQIKQEGILDFSVISDHSDVTNARDFFRGFTDTEAAQPMELVMFPGSESEVTVIEDDRLGLPHKNSGEIVCLNADNFVSAHTWQEFYDALATSSHAVCILAHPQVVGWDKNGIWDFCLHKNNTPRLRELVKGVELGNGGDRGSNSLHEYMYSVALDNGFRVSCTCASDSHGPVWGAKAMPGRTVIMAGEKSREAFLDALLNCRFYACESGNLKVHYSVNGQTAPADLKLTERYDFSVETSQFHEDPDSVPVKCQVISDFGEMLMTVENADFRSFAFTVESGSARYFYLRFVDALGRKTWTMPVWTGRECTAAPEEEMTPICSDGFVVTESGCDAAVLMNGDPSCYWSSGKETADLVIDMRKVQRVCGLGHYAPRLMMRRLKEAGLEIHQVVTHFANAYRLSVSSDGADYTPVASGIFRRFGSEEVIRFPVCDARYIRLQVLSTTGKACELPQYADFDVHIGELTVFAP